MTLKQYGTRLISNFFYAFLIAETLMCMKSIWADFKEYSDCNNEYTANLTRLISESNPNTDIRTKMVHCIGNILKQQMNWRSL